MKIYNFNPNDHGNQFTILAENEIHAHECLIEYLQTKLQNYIELEYEYHVKAIQQILNTWLTVNPLDKTTFPRQYTLDVYEVGQVIQSALAGKF